MKYFIIIMFFAVSALSAQQIYFCKSYTESGQPIDADINFEIEKWGTSIYILFDNEGVPIDESLLYLFIDKKFEEDYEPFDSKALRIDSRDKWTVVDYKFIEAGTYKVYFMDSKQRRLAEETVAISIKEKVEGRDKVYASSYYDNCKIVFCERVLAEKPLNVKSSMNLTQNNGEIFVYLNNHKPMNSNKLLLDVWRKKNRAFEYDEFVVSKKYKINSDWEDAFFKFKFAEKGEYKFSIFNENELPIGSAYFVVK